MRTRGDLDCRGGPLQRHAGPRRIFAMAASKTNLRPRAGRHKRRPFVSAAGATGKQSSLPESNSGLRFAQTVLRRGGDVKGGTAGCRESRKPLWKKICLAEKRRLLRDFRPSAVGSAVFEARAPNRLPVVVLKTLRSLPAWAVF